MRAITVSHSLVLSVVMNLISRVILGPSSHTLRLSKNDRELSRHACAGVAELPDECEQEPVAGLPAPGARPTEETA